MTTSSQPDETTLLRRSYAALSRLRQENEDLKASRRVPIAIVGIGCRFPGGVRDPETFWNALENEADTVREVPSDRWNADSVYDPDPVTPGKSMTRFGSFLDDVRSFDAAFFEIAPVEAVSLDPQQRLLLEVTWEALEHAGIVPARLTGTRVGTYVGVMHHDYAQLQAIGGDAERIGTYTGTGTGTSFAAGRLAYFFGFRGPCLAVDTACSSSLTSIHLAVRDLRHGDCNVAVAGGVNLILSPYASIMATKLRALSVDGRCKAFSAMADGFGRGEGCGVLVLKRLPDALAANDRVVAVIAGSAINHDGPSAGLTIPSGPAQEELLKAALEDAGVIAAEVDYVDAHGTGTRLGDPIEIQALANVFGRERPRERPLLVGSIKSNFAHTEAAAGVAGLIKAALCVERGRLPASLHASPPNPLIPFEQLPVAVVRAAQDWPQPPRCAPRRAGVSAFGLAGSNGHVVVAEAPARVPYAPAPARASLVLPISARSFSALPALATAYRDQIESGAYDVEHVIAAAAVRRSHSTYRAAAVGVDTVSLVRSLNEIVERQPRQRPVTPAVGKMIFVCAGQGSHRAGMGAALLRTEPVFAEAVRQFDEHFVPRTGWSIAREMASGLTDARLRDPRISQACIVAYQAGVAAVLRAWGVEPHAVVGHSVGEVAAALVAGIIGVEDAVRIVVERGNAMAPAIGQGGMIGAAANAARCEAAIAEAAPLVEIAACNSRDMTVLSGDRRSLDALSSRLRDDGIAVLPVDVDTAFHSDCMTEPAQCLQAALHGITGAPAQIAFGSSVEGRKVGGAELTAEYWSRNLRERVRFADMVEEFAREPSTFLELGARPVLQGALRQLSRGSGGVALSATKGAAEDRELSETLGAIYALGYNVDWRKFYRPDVPAIDLPAYPWQRREFWLPDLELHRDDKRAHRARPAHEPRTWTIAIAPRALPFLLDHRVHGAIVAPGALFAELALSVGRIVFPDANVTLADLAFERPLVLEEHGEATVDLNVTQETPDEARFTIESSRTSGENVGIVSGRFRAGRSTAAERAGDETQPGGTAYQRADADDFYGHLALVGMEYGPAFRAVREMAFTEDGVLATLEVPDAIGAEQQTYSVHPAFLDACLHVAAGLFAKEHSSELYLPTGIGELCVLRRPEPAETFTCSATLDEADTHGGVRRTNATIRDALGQSVIVIRGLTLARVGEAAPAPVSETGGVFHLAWEEAPPPDESSFSADVSAAGANDAAWLVLGEAEGIGEDLRARLLADGVAHATLVSSNESDEFIAEHFTEPGDGGAARWGTVVDLRALDYGAEILRADDDAENLRTDEPLRSVTDACRPLVALAAALRMAKRAATRIVLVTRGAQVVRSYEDPSPVHAAMWGMGRVLRSERLIGETNLLDLDPAAGSVAAVDALYRACRSPRPEAAVRGGAWFVPRLVPKPELNDEQPADRERSLNVRFECRRPGTIEQLDAIEFPTPAPSAGEIVVRVRAASLNFLDVLAVLGVRPDLPPGAVPQIGSECAGTVHAVGPDVTGFAVGDDVVAVAPGSLAGFVVTSARNAVHRPAGLSFEQAAAIPIAFMTAVYALEELARLQPEDSVLIHSASGGVGLAAIQVARRRGARILATAGSEAKREYLRNLGVRDVFDSRDLAFSDGVKAATDGRGIDVALNTLSGAAQEATFELLAPYGRLVELGKRDIYEGRKLSLTPFRQNLSFFAVDLGKLYLHRPAHFERLLRGVFHDIEAGALQPLPTTVYPIDETWEAFHTMARSHHLGKISVAVGDGIRSAPRTSVLLPHRSIYLITGGSGALGLACTELLLRAGATDIVLMNRHVPDEQTTARICELETFGARVRFVAADVADRASLERAFEAVRSVGLPLRGVFHLAGVVDDVPLHELSTERLAQSMAAKVAGAWNLHRLTAGDPLDHFMMFSSVSALVGPPAQGAYAAANAFLDGFASFRRQRGLPAQSIAWGPWREAGMAVQTGAAGRAASYGFAPIATDDALRMLSTVLVDGDVSTVIAPLNRLGLSRYRGQTSRVPLLADLFDRFSDAAPSADVATPFVEAFRAASDRQERLDLVRTMLRNAIAAVLGLPAAEVDDDAEFRSLGLDSLTGLELSVRVANELGVAVDAAAVLLYPTTSALASLLEAKMTAALDSDARVGVA